MPALSSFYGIIVRMQNETGAVHHKPHIHAVYGDDEIVLTIDGETLEGEFPNKQLKILQAWIAIHEEELKLNWELLQKGEGYIKIEPLR